MVILFLCSFSVNLFPTKRQYRIHIDTVGMTAVLKNNGLAKVKAREDAENVMKKTFSSRHKYVKRLE